MSFWSDFHFLWCNCSVISNLSISSNVKHRVCSFRPWSMWQLCLSFYQRSNNSDRFVNLASHFIRVQIFQIYFSLKSEKFLCPTSHCNFPIVQWANEKNNGTMDKKLLRPYAEKNTLEHWNIWTLDHWNIGTFDIQSASIFILWQQLHWYCLSD